MRKNLFLALLVLLLGMSSSNNCIFMHKIETSRTGSKSEAKHGFLYFQNKKIPDTFNLIVSSECSFQFFQRKYLWGLDGYHPSQGKEKEFFKTKNSSKNLEGKFFLLGDIKFANIPSNWIFVKWANKSAFINPLKIFDFIKLFNLKKISREKPSSKIKIKSKSND